MYADRRESSKLRLDLIPKPFQIVSRTQTCYSERYSQQESKVLNRLLTVVLISFSCLISNSIVAGDLYLRGGLAYDSFNDAVFMDTYCPSGTPAALYGCGIGSDDLPYSSKGSFDRFQSFEIGLGLSTLSDIRVEFLIEYQSRTVFDGNTNFLNPELQQSVTAELSTLSSSFVGYLDFTQMSMLGSRNLVPYIGVGFGVTRNQIDTTTMTFPVTTTTVPGDSYTSLKWIASLGATMDLSDRMKLDFGLRYTDRCKVRTGLGEGAVNWRNRVRDPLSLDLARTEAKLRGYSLRISIRYSP